MVAEWAAALAASGGAALVGAVATDAWQSARVGFARLFGRGDPVRQRRAETRLDATRAEIARAGDSEVERVRHAQMLAWQARLADLLEENPEVTDELRALASRITATDGVRVIGTTVGGAHVHGDISGGQTTIVGRDNVRLDRAHD